MTPGGKIGLMNHPPRPRAVLFDVDGLMLDTERPARAVWQQALAEHGYPPVEDALYEQFIGRSVADVEAILMERFGPGFTFKPVYERRRDLGTAVFEREGIAWKPGLRELIDYLRAKRIPYAIATSSYEPVSRDKFARTGLDEIIETAVFGDQVAHGKPAPDLFVEAAHRLGLPPAECLVLEDSGPGIEAAHAAGAIPVLVPDMLPPSPRSLALAYRVLPSLHEVIPLLETWDGSGK